MSTTPLTNDELRAEPVATTGPLTDDELRASPVEVTIAKVLFDALPVSVSLDDRVSNVQAETWPLPIGAASEETLQALHDRLPAQGQAPSASSTPVVVASDQSPVPTTVTGTAETKEKRSRTAKLSMMSSRADIAAILLPANADRLGASIYNDSTATLYVGIGDLPSTVFHSVQLLTGDYFELPANFTGPVYGIWASVNGAARITEYLP